MRFLLLLCLLGMLVSASAESCRCVTKTQPCQIDCAWCPACSAGSLCSGVISNVKAFNASDAIKVGNDTTYVQQVTELTAQLNMICTQPDISNWAEYGGANHGQCLVGGVRSYDCPNCKVCKTTAICSALDTPTHTVLQLVGNTTKTYTHAKAVLQLCISPPAPPPYGGVGRLGVNWLLLLLLATLSLL